MVQSRKSKRLKTAHGSDSDVIGLSSLGNDMLVGLCIHLQSNDLASISSTCKYFGEKSHGCHSLMDGIAKQMVEQLANDEEKSLLQQRYDGDNGILLYDRLLMLRSPLLFEQLIGQGLEYVGTDKNRVSLPVMTGSAMHTAISNQVTRSSGGKHYATFTVRGGGEVSC